MQLVQLLARVTYRLDLYMAQQQIERDRNDAYKLQGQRVCEVHTQASLTYKALEQSYVYYVTVRSGPPSALTCETGPRPGTLGRLGTLGGSASQPSHSLMSVSTFLLLDAAA